MYFKSLTLLVPGLLAGATASVFAETPASAHKAPAANKAQPAAVKEATPSTEPRTTKLAGIWVPPAGSVQVAWLPDTLGPVTIEGSPVAHAAKVTKGQKLVPINLERLGRAIEDARVQLENDRIALARAELDFNFTNTQAKSRLEKAALGTARVEQDIEDYSKQNRPRMLEELEMKLAKAENFVKYKQEELKQLEKLYTDDQLTDESEEIVLIRTRNEMDDLKFGLAGARLGAEIEKKRKFVRMDQDLDDTLKATRLAEDRLKAEVPLELTQKKIAVDAAKLKVARGEDALKRLESDISKAEFSSPADGSVYYGVYQDGAWSGPAALKKLRHGGRLEPAEAFITIVPSAVKPDAWRVVVPVPPQNPAPAADEAVTLKWAGVSVPGTVVATGSTPDADGVRRATVAPLSSLKALPVAPAPGLPVEVIFSQPAQSESGDQAKTQEPTR